MGSVNSFSIGQSVSLSKVFTQQDVESFASITGDTNPVHLDAGYAAKTLFKRPIVHGLLTAGLVSAVIGTKLPGPGAIYLGQTLNFRSPVYTGEQITVKITIIEIKTDKSIIVLQAECYNQSSMVVLDGVATIKVLN
jgi:3-hydroxybutyryl-CoA dehydratase